MARAAVKAALVVLAVAAGSSGCGGSAKSASKTAQAVAASVSSTPTAASSTGTSPSPSPSAPATSASSSAAPTPSTAPPDFTYRGTDPDICPWVKAAELAKATRHTIATIKISVSANGVKTCQFGPPPPVAGQTEAPLDCNVTFVGGPGAATTSYFNEAVAQAHLSYPQPIAGVGVKSEYSDPELYVLTKHGVAIVGCATVGGDPAQDDSQSLDVAAFHAAEHSF